jgi:hypothetical protein
MGRLRKAAPREWEGVERKEVTPSKKNTPRRSSTVLPGGRLKVSIVAEDDLVFVKLAQQEPAAPATDPTPVVCRRPFQVSLVCGNK